MNEAKRDDLLRDLAKLLVKYGPEDWRHLISALQDEAYRRSVISALEALLPLTGVARREGKREAAWPRARPAGLLAELETQDPRRHELLSTFRRHMLERRLLGSARALEEFARVCGIEGPIPAKRPQAVNVLLRNLSARPMEELERLLKQVGPPEAPREGRDFGAEYEHWVDLILRRTR